MIKRLTRIALAGALLAFTSSCTRSIDEITCMPLWSDVRPPGEPSFIIPFGTAEDDVIACWTWTTN